MYPSIDLEDARLRLGEDTYRRGVNYAREGRVMRCLWDPDTSRLVGSVRGNKGRSYATTVQLCADITDTSTIDYGRCTLPMQLDCKKMKKWSTRSRRGRCCRA